uniref:FMN-dependent NADPH-azoreductase n=2 Tax=Lygus hesperus TaxID=30085 RepID=A0A0A9X1E2_LYGHE
MPGITSNLWEVEGQSEGELYIDDDIPIEDEAQSEGELYTDDDIPPSPFQPYSEGDEQANTPSPVLVCLSLENIAGSSAAMQESQVVPPVNLEHAPENQETSSNLDSSLPAQQIRQENLPQASTSATSAQNPGLSEVCRTPSVDSKKWELRLKILNAINLTRAPPSFYGGHEGKIRRIRKKVKSLQKHSAGSEAQKFELDFMILGVLRLTRAPPSFYGGVKGVIRRVRKELKTLRDFQRGTISLLKPASSKNPKPLPKSEVATKDQKKSPSEATEAHNP